MNLDIDLTSEFGLLFFQDEAFQKKSQYTVQVSISKMLHKDDKRVQTMQEQGPRLWNEITESTSCLLETLNSTTNVNCEVDGEKWKLVSQLRNSCHETAIATIVFNVAKLCPSKVEGAGVGSLRPNLYFSMGKAQKLGFPCFSEQTLAMFVLYAIYFDKSLA